MNRKVQLAIGEYYHLYSRGANKMPIFIDDQDYSRFQRLLFLANSSKPIHIQQKGLLATYKVDRGEVLVNIGLYCQMKNHFHILVKEIRENGISDFMKKLLTAYSMYFNKKYKHSGTLFESRYKSTHQATDEQLKYLYSYIHLNPVKYIEPNWKTEGIQNIVEARKYLSAYKYSSYLDYVGNHRLESKILNRESFPGYFENPHDFGDFINEWLNYVALSRSDLGMPRSDLEELSTGGV